ncbi:MULTISPECIES: class I SAM-dependent methyltransferase [unclassified Lentimicrobium]|uniref:class I SAM-dependent methyltransferase n=1 Tax=unclassified Lentimicrobium TaxID=2677434 RepID=UPI0015574611|nr:MULTISPECIES: class I SAM-dependent methyltransferase [unclassified Lentimicrobium]NPD48161.1 class I SAM-dependent methyltransferase [Lentimicrobium sp. S6]NPD86382.1 class I SAM-dependent methyltransferase [Lentimicrobium sp. L6]
MISKTQKFWDKQAKRYDDNERQFDPVFKEIILGTKNHLSANDKVLDFGCATGTKTIALAESVKHIHGLDTSSEMINEANKKIIGGHLKNISFAQGDVFDNGFKMASFDKIISYGVIHLLNDSNKTIGRIHNLLKRDGLFISSTACLESKMAFKNSLEFKAFRLIKNLGFFPLHLNMFTPEKVERLLTNQGFEIIKAETIFHGITISFIIARKWDKD